MKTMFEPQTAEYIVHNDNLPFWQSLNKESYFDILSIVQINETQNKIFIQYDNAYIGFIFGDIFHAGVQCGIKAMSKNPKTV